MLFFVKVRVEPKEMSLDELWENWEKQADVGLKVKEAGKMVALYKMAGQRRVVGILDVESHDELDQILMNALPMAHYIEVEEIAPVRPYEAFAEDVKKRWKS